MVDVDIGKAAMHMVGADSIVVDVGYPSTSSVAPKLAHILNDPLTPVPPRIFSHPTSLYFQIFCLFLTLLYFYGLFFFPKKAVLPKRLFITDNIPPQPLVGHNASTHNMLAKIVLF